MENFFTQFVPEVGQVVKTGGERYEGYNSHTVDLKAGDAVSLQSGLKARIGVKKWEEGEECIGYVVSEPINMLIKQGQPLTFASTSSFIALNAKSDIAVGDELVPDADGIKTLVPPTDPEDPTPAVVAIAYTDAEEEEIVICKLVVR